MKTKNFWVRIKQIVSTAEGAIYGIGTNGKIYIWHHSFEHKGKWVLHIRSLLDERAAIELEKINARKK